MSSTSSSTQNLSLNLPSFQETQVQNVSDSTENNNSFYPQKQLDEPSQSLSESSHAMMVWNPSVTEEESSKLTDPVWNSMNLLNTQSSTSSVEFDRFVRSEAPTPTLKKSEPSHIVLQDQKRGVGMDDLHLDSQDSVIPLSDQLVLPPVSELVSQDSLLAETRMYMQQAAMQEKQYKSLASSANKALFDLKVSELELEQQLLMDGSLQDYQERLKEIEAKKEENVVFIQEHMAQAMSSFEQVYQSQVKLALDTYSERKRILRKKLREKMNTLQHQLRAEYGRFDTQEILPYISDFQIPPTTVAKKRRLTFDQLSLGPGYTCDIAMPEWIRHVLKLRRRAGLDPVAVPCACEGLDEVEMEQDLSFLQFQQEKPQMADSQDPLPDVNGIESDDAKHMATMED